MKWLQRLKEWGRRNSVPPAPDTMHRRPDPQERFDALSRAMASSMPRREVLRLLVRGLAGAALLSLGVKSAWAATECTCNGSPMPVGMACCEEATPAQLYDPRVHCCTPFGLQLKYPIVDLAKCPNRVPHPGYVPGTNGCTLVPDTFGAADFTACCNTHDICYGTCNRDRAGCDLALFACGQAVCLAAYPGAGRIETFKRRACLELVNTGLTVIQNAGQPFYDAGQREACDCCGDTEPCCLFERNMCGNICCDAGAKCVNGSCCASENVCGETCCAPDEKCINGRCGCPLERLCETDCCEVDEVCLGAGCCSLNDVCGEEPFQDCCTKEEVCLDGACCASENVCAGVCCDPDAECVNGRCECGPGTTTCGEGCCSKEEVCLNENFCCPSERACGNLCCADEATCVAGSCVVPGGNPEACLDTESCRDPGFCGGFVFCGFSGGEFCRCLEAAGSQCFCHAEQSCASSQLCSSNAECPAGFVCSASTCCDAPVCIQPCGSDSVPFIRGKTTTSQFG
jgi:hypothetical protein